ncbi:gag/pol protein [Cucumis melo var. makuwa]|uniref:Gag/pol protein n=1 Tax=Cucumis melo var. makuwa TaxID=1194695 RepID=A0A5A7UJJ5_CUCMM|nr:gag/pol protein [Cucumis melo var. makuwa]
MSSNISRTLPWMKKKGKGKTPKNSEGKKFAKGKCYHYNQNGYWLRNYLKYLTEKKSKKEAQEGEIILKVKPGKVVSAAATGDLKLFT